MAQLIGKYSKALECFRGTGHLCIMTRNKSLTASTKLGKANHRLLPEICRNIVFICSKTLIPVAKNSKTNHINSCLQTFPVMQYVTKQNSCWKCGENTNAKAIFFCDKCDALQKPDLNKTYFDILGVERKFDFNKVELTKKYHILQTQLHPDHFSNHSKKEQELSAECSSLVNKAYSTLIQPLDRGIYMLKLEGLSLEDGDVQMDPDFLMEMLELNEEVDSVNDKESLEKLFSKNKKVLNNLMRALSQAFDKSHIPHAKRILAKLKYFNNIDMKLRELRREMGVID